MKFMTMCAGMLLAVGLVACGGKDPKLVKTIGDNTDKLTEDQIATALDWAIEAQEKQLDDLDEKISDSKQLLLEQKAYEVGMDVAYKGGHEGDVAKSDAYKAKKETLIENEQKIKAKKEELLKALEEAEKDLGWD